MAPPVVTAVTDYNYPSAAGDFIAVNCSVAAITHTGAPRYLQFTPTITNPANVAYLRFPIRRPTSGVNVNMSTAFGLFQTRQRGGGFGFEDSSGNYKIWDASVGIIDGIITWLVNPDFPSPSHSVGTLNTASIQYFLLKIAPSDSGQIHRFHITGRVAPTIVGGELADQGSFADLYTALYSATYTASTGTYSTAITFERFQNLSNLLFELPAQFFIGNNDSTYFSSSRSTTVYFPAKGAGTTTQFSSGYQGFTVNSTQSIEFNNCTFIGDASYGFFASFLGSTNHPVSSSGFNTYTSITFNSVQNVNRSYFINGTGLISGGNQFRNCTVSDCTATSAYAWNGTTDITGTSFDNCNHAIQIATSGITYSLSSNTFTDCIPFNVTATTGTVTIEVDANSSTDVSGGFGVNAYTSAGATVVFVLPGATLSFTGIPSGTNAKLTQGSKVVAEEDNITDGTFSYSYSQSGEKVFYQFNNPGYEEIYESLTLSSVSQSIPLSFVPDPSYVA